MATQVNWSTAFSDTETKEEALIRIYNETEGGTSFTLQQVAQMFNVSTMAVNKKLGHLRKKGLVGYREVIKNETPLKDRPKGHGDEWSENVQKGTACLDIVSSYKFEKIEDALMHHKIDTDVWEVESFRRGFWTTPIAPKVDKNGNVVEAMKVVENFYLRINFRRRKDRAPKMAWVELMKDVPKFRYSEKIPKFVTTSGVAMELAPIDAHFAKLAWDEETRRGDYDLEIATKNYMQVIEQNLSWGGVFKPEKIFFIVGQDLMHSENYSGTTPMGHNILDVDTRLPMIIRTAMEINIKAVYRCRSLAPTEVIWIPGNHDPTASLWLCHTLQQHFRDDKHVTVDVSASSRKARLWGNLLVGWTHMITGRHAAWANELAQAFPRLWGRSKYREWHHGHTHKKNEVKMSPVSTEGGVLMRQLTALSPIDAWHFENLFTDAVPGGEAFLWSKDKGVFSNFVAWL